MGRPGIATVSDMSGIPRDPFRLTPNPRADRGPAHAEVADELVEPLAAAIAAGEIGSWPGHELTPLCRLDGLARAANLGEIWYKDEGGRFGLGSFKPLGGGYAVNRLLARQVRRAGGRFGLKSSDLLSGKHRSTTDRVTVACATDGNHGRAVAWAASRFGARSVVYLADIVTPYRERRIAELGAEIVRSAGTHDVASRECREAAAREGWFVISETENATEPQIALDTLAGYSVLWGECAIRLRFRPTIHISEGRAVRAPPSPPTHIFVQAGVGGLAGCAAAVIARHWGTPPQPKLVVVEAESADCIRRSLERGERIAVDGPFDTRLAGLAAGVVSGYAWRLLETGADFGLAIPDSAAFQTMRLLADPPWGDRPIAGGESGVAGLAGALLASGDPEARAALGLDAHSRVLTIGTEGATDPESYAVIVGRRPEEVVPEPPLG